MEMTWMETFQLLGLDLLAVMLLALVVSTSSNMPSIRPGRRHLRASPVSPKAVVAPRVNIGGVKHV